MIEVVLTDAEVRIAASVGVARAADALANARRESVATGTGAWQTHVEGACGEMAAAKALGRYWNGSVNTFKNGGDVGALQVRTRSEHHYELIVRDGDRDDDYFVLVTGLAPSFRVVGWIKAADAKLPDYRKDHGGHGAAFFVPHAALTPMR